MERGNYIIKNRTEGRGRKRKYGGGRRAVLNKTEDKFLFILFYTKLYPFQGGIGFIFGMSRSQANDRIHILSALLKAALSDAGHLPERVPGNPEDVPREDGADEVTTDATERRRRRPKDPVRQKIYYSGKKKGHTVKDNLIVTPEDRKVKYLSDTYEGKKHDL